MSARPRSLALVIPVYNEEAVLGRLIEAIDRYRTDRPRITEVIFVDDGSRDGSAELIQSLTHGRSGYRLVRFSRNFGHQLAVTAGLNAVTADAAVVMDADLQDPLEVVDDMVERWDEGFDVVYGVRGHREGQSLLQRASARVYYRFFNWFTGFDAPLDAGDFRLMSARVIDAFGRMGEQQPYVRGLVAWLGFRQTGVAYDRPDRAAGSPKYNRRRLFALARHGLTAFTDRPLKWAVRFGLGLSLLSVAGLVWVLVVRFTNPDLVPGWASLIFAAFFFGGLNLFFLGIVGSYVSRVYDEVKARPRYVIADEWSSAPSESGRAEPSAPAQVEESWS